MYNGMSGALDPVIQQEIIDRDQQQYSLVTVTSMVVSIHISIPSISTACRSLCNCRNVDIEKDALGHDKEGNPIYTSGHLTLKLMP